MVNFTINDLQYSYQWNISEPQINNFPTDEILLREEGYAVLYFINTYLQTKGWNSLEHFKMVERRIRFFIPTNVKSYHNIKNWLDNNLVPIWES